jgi:hypothetical protein
MKVVFTGAEYYLSDYLNSLKMPLVAFVVAMLVMSFFSMMDYNKSWKDTVIGKHPIAYTALCILTSAYLFLVWK